MSTCGGDEAGSQTTITGFPRNASEEFGSGTCTTSMTSTGNSGVTKDSVFGQDHGVWYPSDGPDAQQVGSMNAALGQDNKEVLLQIPSARRQQGSTGGAISDCSEGENLDSSSSTVKDDMMPREKRSMASDNKDAQINLVDATCGGNVDAEDSKDMGDELMVTPTGETIRLVKLLKPKRTYLQNKVVQYLGRTAAN